MQYNADARACHHDGSKDETQGKCGVVEEAPESRPPRHASRFGDMAKGVDNIKERMETSRRSRVSLASRIESASWWWWLSVQNLRENPQKPNARSTRSSRNPTSSVKRNVRTSRLYFIPFGMNKGCGLS